MAAVVLGEIKQNMMRPVLFLDIDGVLNGHQRHEGLPYTRIMSECVQALNHILATVEPVIVLSSAWRYMIHGGQLTLAGFRYLLITHGVQGYPPGSNWLVGLTCCDEEIADRGEQILAYLRQSPADRWCVLDDDPMEMELGNDAWRLVRTTGDVGLTMADAERAIQVLRS